MEKKVSIVLVGINGYGVNYLKELLAHNYKKARLVGVVEIYPKRSEFYEELLNQKVPIYDRLEHFYENNQADLAVISTPIHLHAPQSCYAMNHGSHVLCEKPMTASSEDMKKMIETRDKTGKFLAVGFNWSFTPSIQQLKQDIINGKFGKPIRAKSVVLWPRNQDYYNRSSWAGKRYSPNGDMIFDSVANNATAHYLHNLFYLTGNSLSASSKPKEVTAELYKINPIETFDTCAVKIVTDNDVELLYLASHAVKDAVNPQFEFEFETAKVSFQTGVEDNKIIAHFNDGEILEYKNPNNDSLAKLAVCIDAVVNGHTDILCGPEASSSHVLSIEAMHKSVTSIPSFPKHLGHFEKDKKLYWIEGLQDILIQSYNNWSLPSELSVEWSVKGDTVPLQQYL